MPTNHSAVANNPTIGEFFINQDFFAIIRSKVVPKLTVVVSEEDCGQRYREVLLPSPRSPEWAREVSQPFRDYFETLATAKATFLNRIMEDGFEYVANVHSTVPLSETEALEAIAKAE